MFAFIHYDYSLCIIHYVLFITHFLLCIYSIIDYSLCIIIGHYVCFTFGNHSVLRINDEKIEFVEYNSVRQIIRTCGYIFIYRKIGDHFLNDNESNETDTETSEENNSLSHGKFMKNANSLVSPMRRVRSMNARVTYVSNSNLCTLQRVNLEVNG